MVDTDLDQKCLQKFEVYLLPTSANHVLTQINEFCISDTIDSHSYHSINT